MTVHDGHRLADALDDLSERALTPAVMLGDSHYGSSDNMALTREQNINLVAPARPPKGAVSGRLTLEDFTLNEEGLVLRCPNNVEPVSASLAKAKLQARFDLSICQKCPDILRCPVQAAKRDGQFSRFQYTPARAANQKRRLYEQSDAFRNVYRWRAGIEATLPIRLSPTPTICSVSPWTAGKGRRRRIEEAIRLILDCSENRTGV